MHAPSTHRSPREHCRSDRHRGRHRSRTHRWSAGHSVVEFGGDEEDEEKRPVKQMEGGGGGWGGEEGMLSY